MDWQTSIQLLLNELGKGHPDDIAQAKISTIKAMEFLRHSEFEFNQETHNWTMVQGQQAYGATGDFGDQPLTVLSSNLLRPKVIQIKSGSTWYAPLKQKDHSIIREWTYVDATGYGSPAFYSWWDRQVHVYPLPNTGFTSRIDYVKDLNRPRFRWDGSQFLFEEQATAAPYAWSTISDTYTNGWLSSAESLVRAWAKWDLYLNFYKNEERAQESREVFFAEKDRIRSESVNFSLGDIRQEATVL
jgi:hypothetical protein